MDTISLYKHRIDSLMDILFGAGVSNPQTIIEQINYLLFLRALSIKDDEAELLGITDESGKIFSGDLAKYRWQNLLALNAEDLFKTVESSFEVLQKESKNPTVKLLFRNAHVKIFDKPTLRRVLHEIEEFAKELDKIAHGGNKDVFGDMYEYLLSKLSSAGTNGQFRTPRHIIDFMVHVIDPKKNETILDPACGTAGFLVSAYRYIAGEYTSDKMEKAGSPRAMDKLTQDEKNFLFNHMFSGFDSDEDMIKFGMMNLHLHGLTKSNLVRQNSLTDTAGVKDKFDVVLANPPFAGKIDEESVSEDIRMGTKATELLFLRFIIDHLSEGGRAAVIIPQGVLSDRTKAAKMIRKKLLLDCSLEAVISLPTGCFRPYADAETAILVFKKGGETKSVWMYEVKADGFALDDKRSPILENDLPDALLQWKTRADSKNSFNVDLSKIQEHDNLLNVGEYKQDQLSSLEDALPSGWSLVKLSEIIDEVSEKAGKSHTYPVLSVTKHKGFVESATYFNKRVFSSDTSGYKLVRRGEFAYSTIHLDEGSVGYLEKIEAGVISPMYKVFKLKNAEKIVRAEFLYHILKSPVLIEKYKTLGRGSVKRRKSISFDKFGGITIPIPPMKVQERVIKQIEAVRSLEAQLEQGYKKLGADMGEILRLVGLE